MSDNFKMIFNDENSKKGSFTYKNSGCGFQRKFLTLRDDVKKESW
jgi:hypothetical protein